MAHPIRTKPISVLVVEDSPAQQELLVALLTQGGFTVAGVVSNGKAAIATTESLHPDIVVMDIHLPSLNGYEATKQIMQRCPTPIVLISSIRSNLGQHSVEALAAGALAVVRTPAGPLHADHAHERDALCTTVRLMANVPVITRFAQRGALPQQSYPSALPLVQQRSAAPATPQILAIAASTGGPQTLQRVLCELGANFPIPILVVQHIAAGFAEPMAEWLTRVIPLKACIARQHEALLPGSVYLAPDGAHLVVHTPAYAALRAPGPEDRYCPSADHLFASVAKAYGPGAIGVILTGMGDDGSQGLRALRAAGGYTLVQDEASCVVPGMPMAAVRNGAVERIELLANLASAVRERVAEPGQNVRGR